MENVPQMLFHPQFQQLLELLGRDYAVRYAILNAARYGTPQTRHRAFVLAYSRDLGVEPTFPAPTHGFKDKPAYNYLAKRLEYPSVPGARSRDVLGADPVITRILALPPQAQCATFAAPLTPERPLITVREAIGDLTPLNPASGIEEYPGAAASVYQLAVRGAALRLSNHKARAHDAKLRDLIARIPPGGDLADAPCDLWPKSHYSQAYGRLHWEGLARTVTTFFCNAGSGRFIHPADPRTLTVREAARLQGFCDEYEFVGTQAEQMRLVGNAVPVPLAQALGTHIAATLRDLEGKGGGSPQEPPNGGQPV
jgi:DNA (cytosine-5)-methyltransferase 1